MNNIDFTNQLGWKRYDIEGNEITVVTCENCYNQIDINKLRKATQNDDETVKCCDRPSYYITQWDVNKRFKELGFK